MQARILARKPWRKLPSPMYRGHIAETIPLTCRVPTTLLHSSHAVSLPKLKIGLRCSSRNVILQASKRESTKRASLTLKSTTCGTLEKMNTESQDVWTLAHTARLKRYSGNQNATERGRTSGQTNQFHTDLIPSTPSSTRGHGCRHCELQVEHASGNGQSAYCGFSNGEFEVGEDGDGPRSGYFRLDSVCSHRSPWGHLRKEVRLSIP